MSMKNSWKKSGLQNKNERRKKKKQSAGSISTEIQWEKNTTRISGSVTSLKTTYCTDELPLAMELTYRLNTTTNL